VPNEQWDAEVAQLWARAGELPDEELVVAVDELAAELPADDAAGPFEQACARDSTGDPDGAVALYRRALELGLTGLRRRRAVVQLASSLRNLGRPAESARLLEAELAGTSDDLDDAVRAFLALALADLGREREGLALAIGALAPRLPRYQRSLGAYARALVEPPG
jgi:tetratricopeptide (TPR) repeat protein